MQLEYKPGIFKGMILPLLVSALTIIQCSPALAINRSFIIVVGVTMLAHPFYLELSVRLHNWLMRTAESPVQTVL